MRISGTAVSLTALLLAAVLALVGCGGGETAARVDEAVGLVASGRTLLEDLLDLDQRLNSLGTRFTAVEDTMAEGKSLAEMAMADVDELEARYNQARDMLRKVADDEGAGDYATYARLALVAVETELEALAVNRQLLSSVWDMLDVLPLAQSGEQLSYYVEEIDRLTAEVSDLLRQGADAATEADRYYREKGL